ncbi:hypothetical protein HHK36_006943 [Tetracentron sinense]|uniref:VQ domain-containing protein n=1 Tax=Tetracentron sinense TaxID=13715 RepID=A0A835DPN8_TETSI|nr:hypothetical protein HHK36_006943 [Tetracentron sinense]
MSPVNFINDQHAKKEINIGSRPSPLKIKHESHFIQKSSSSSSSSSLTNGAAAAPKQQPQQQYRKAMHQQRHPVIIYTHSPRIIKTQARDFMALVQKLTGLSRSENQEQQPQSQQISLEGNKDIKGVESDDNESSSVVTNENCGSLEDVKLISSSSVSDPIFNHPNPYFSDIPLFTPSSMDFFCSTQPFYRYSDSIFVSPNMGSSISPSIMEVMKGFPDY